MGTQQILLIVLSVIIVGVAIAVGITMFSNQAFNSNQQALSGELQNYASQCIQFFKTPEGQGGAGNDTTKVVLATLANFINFSGTGETLDTDNGTFKITDGVGGTVVLEGIGKESKGGEYPKITTTIVLTTGAITSVVSRAATHTSW